MNREMLNYIENRPVTDWLIDNEHFCIQKWTFQKSKLRHAHVYQQV